MWYVRKAKPQISLCQSLDYSISVKQLTEHHLELLSLKGGCIGSSESTLVKLPHCWKISHVATKIYFIIISGYIHNNELLIKTLKKFDEYVLDDSK